jgi:ketosteroid isomerase-like protein
MTEIEQQVRTLADIEHIRRLKAAYCAVADDDHNGEALTELFVPDGTWSASISGEYRGHDAMRAHFDGIRASGRIEHSSHMVMNPVIDVDGDTATGTWSFLMMYTGSDGSRVRIVGFYHDTYVRVDGQWKFATLHAQVQDQA